MLPLTTDIPVSRADSISVEPILTKQANVTKLAVRVTWNQTRDLDKLKGYIFRMQRKNALVTRLRIYVNSTFFKNLSMQENSVEFQLSYENEYTIYPGKQYYCNIIPIPSYQLNTEIPDVETECNLIIPGCRDNENYPLLRFCKDEEMDRKRKRKKKKKRPNDKSTKNQKKEEKNIQKIKAEQSSVSWVMLVVVPTVLVLCFFSVGIYFAFKCSFKRNGSNRLCHERVTSQKLLLVVNKIDEEEVYRNAANAVASMLGTQHAFNLRKDNQPNYDPVTWVQKNMNECGHVLFICTPRGKIAMEEMAKSTATTCFDEFALVYHQVFSSIKVSFTSVYFDVNSDSVPTELKNKGKSFQLPEKLDKFLHHVNVKTAAADYRDCKKQLVIEINDLRNNNLTNTKITKKEEFVVRETIL